MISEKATSTIIHFYQKVIDKKTVIRYTTDFILRIFGLFYQKTHQEKIDETSQKIIQSIQATLYAKIDEYLKGLQILTNNVLEIKFEKDNSIPIVSHHRVTTDSDILVKVFFKRIEWEEINEFRVFLVRFLKHYFEKYYPDQFSGTSSIKKMVDDISYIVQELLQNANQYSEGNYDYELVIRHYDNKIDITVLNYASPENVNKLMRIVNKIKSSVSLKELVMEFMLSKDKHLGIITSVFNYNISSFNVEYVEQKIVKTNFVLKTRW